MPVKNIKFPVQNSQTDGYFETTSTTMETIRQNLLMFFVTDEKERVVNCHLGSRFRRMLFEPDITTVKLKAENEINRIFDSFFPDLVLQSLEVNYLDDTSTSQGVLSIKITYTIKNLSRFEQKLNFKIG